MNSFTGILQESCLDFKEFLTFLFKIFRLSILEKADLSARALCMVGIM